jgi:hypothetical protein
MRLYTLTGAARVDDPEFGSFTANPDGSFDFPNQLSDRLHSFAFGGKRAWESDAEREQRIVSEELDRMRDPATLLAAIKEQGASSNAVLAALASVLGLGVPVAAEAVMPQSPPTLADASTEDAAPAAKRRGRATASKTSTPAE